MVTQEIFVCSLCTKTFSERKRYTQHWKTHSKPLKCEVCAKRFASFYDLNRHATIHRVGLAVFRCSIDDCKFKTTRKDNLSQHIRNIHPDHVAASIVEFGSVESSTILAPKGNQNILTSGFASDACQFSGWKVMMEAASTGDIPRLDCMLQWGQDINMKAEDGYTALHCAAKAGQVATIQYFLRNGANIESSNEQRKMRRPIHEAVLAKYPVAVTALLQAGADILTNDGNGDSIMHYVGILGDAEIAEALFQEKGGQISSAEMASLIAISSVRSGTCSLLKWLLSAYPMPHSSNVRKSLLYIATVGGHQDAFDLLLSSSKTLGCSTPEFAQTISQSLLSATRRGGVDMIKMLLECEAINANQQDTYGQTALHNASRKGDVKVVSLLLGHPEIKVNATRWNGSTPLHLAAKNGHKDVVKLLLNHDGVISRCKDREGQKPLELAFFNCRWEVFRLLAEHEGTTIEVKNDFAEGKLPNMNSNEFWLLTKYLLDSGLKPTNAWEWCRIVQETVLSGATKLAKLLLDQPGFDVNRMVDDWANHTALHIAAQHHGHEIFSLYLDHPKIDVNEVGRVYGQRDSILHCAVRHNCISAVKLLLARRDTDLTLRNREGHTALDLARALGRHEMVELLSNHTNLKLLSEEDSTIAVVDSNAQPFNVTSYDQHLQYIAVQTNFDNIDYVASNSADDDYGEEDMVYENCMENEPN